uniref:Meckel syndrome type 1 protein-like protein n=1 Tax=Schistosoma haematobium TaxID=6185 RepID=A0A094ZHT9_SCHHA
MPTNEMLLEFPPDYYRYVSHLPTRITQEMYIMADLSSDIPNDAADLSPLYMGNEEILCKITIDSNGLLRCKPDFTRGSVKYRIKSKQKVGATNFENPGLYVQYYLELPQNWKAYDHKLLCGSSQIASIKNYGNEEIIMFSHPIEFDLTYKPEISIDLTKGPVSIWPTLYFEVQSLDFWTRSRTEGYGFTELPRIAGAHSIVVSCWRPVGDSVVEELRRFFIGGTCQLEDPTFAKIPGSFEVYLEDKGNNLDRRSR